VPRQRRFLLLAALGAALALPVTSAGASLVPVAQKVVISDARVTATSSGGDSVTELTLTNQSAQPVTLVSVTCSQAASAMLFHDRDVTRGTQPMTYLASITVGAHQRVRLGLRDRGAMLAGLRHRLLVGQHVTLEVRWVQANGVDVTRFVSATVLRAPAHLRFLMN